MFRTGRLHWIALFFALQGAFLRAFIPAGYMPAFSADGLRLAFCSPSGAQLTLDEAPLEHRAQAEHECAYALALSAAPPSVATSFSVPSTPRAMGAATSLVSVAVSARAYLARGPPVLV